MIPYFEKLINMLQLRRVRPKSAMENINVGCLHLLMSH